MASAVATPLEKQFSTIAGIDDDDLVEHAGQRRNITLQFALDRDIDAAAQDVQAAISKTLRVAAAGHHAAVVSEGRTRPTADPVPRAAPRTLLPLSELNEYAETFLAQRISTVKGVAQVQVFGSQKYAVRIQLDPRALAARGIGIDEVASAIAARERRTCRPACCGARTRRPRVQATASSRTRRSSATSSSPTATARRCGSATSATCIDDVQNNTRRELVQRPARRSSLADPAPAGHEHGRRSPRRVHDAARAARAAAARRRSSIDAALRPLGSRSAHSVARRAVHAAAHARARRAGDLPVPAQRARDAHPEPRAAAVDRRHVRGDVAARLQPRQPVADGAHAAVGFVVDDAIVMLENIVRHMEMGKTPHAGGARRLARRSASRSSR